jgi:ATP-binding cassette subfamily C protein LapB
MDAKLENRVMQHLFEHMPTDSAIVVVTHKPSVLNYVSRILVVDKGRVVLDGPRDEVLHRLSQPASSRVADASTQGAVA